MQTFRTLSIADRQLINQILQESFYFDGYNSSELVFENIFVWNYRQQIEILWIEDSIAIIRSLEKEGEWIFMPPVCRSNDEFLVGMKYISKHFPNNLVVGLSQKMVDACKNEKILILYDDYYSEYIYDPRELAEMAGGKFSRKRNLVAQFKKKYTYEFVPYTDAHFQDLKAFLIRYQDEGGAGEDFDAIIHALENKEKLHLFCDLLIVDGLIVGLSIGAISVFNHGVILFEKNDYNYTGSGAILVQLACQSHYQGLKSLSRQEDLGLPQLRKAKLAWNPIVKERKYACLFNPDAIQLHNLYRKSFDDSSDYVDFFFLHSFDINRAYYVKKDKQIVSALHIIMKKMMFNNQILDLPFVVAASTDPQYRRQGLMREVMDHTFADLRKQGYFLTSLFPVNPDFYFDYGFVHYTFGVSLEHFSTSFECNIEQTNDGALLSSMYNHCIADKEGYIMRDENYFDAYLNSLWQDGVVFDLIKKEGETFGYIAHKDGDIDEILLCGEGRPVHKDIAFSEAVMPSPDGHIPLNMMRIIDVKKLLETLTFEKNAMASINLRITDSFIIENNCELNLNLKNGRLTITTSSSIDLTISIEDLTKVIFLGSGNDRLSFLFPKKKLICFDKF